MVRDGLPTLEPLYLDGFAPTFIATGTLLVILFHWTLVAEGVANTVHCNVMEFPNVTVYHSPTVTDGTLPKTESWVCWLCPVPIEFVAKHVYVAASLLSALLIVNEGLEVVDPEYLLMLVFEFMLVRTPFLFFCQKTV